MSASARRAVCALLLTLTGCGGSGGGGGGGAGGASLATFTGTYSAVSGGGTSLPPFPLTVASLSALTPDGAGSMPFNTTFSNLDGAVSAPGADFNTYTVAADGSMTWLSGAQNVFTGGITSTGDVLLGAQVQPGDIPALLAGIRRGSGFSNGALSGVYHYAYLNYRTTSLPNRQTVLGTITFNGSGVITAVTAATVNTGGSANPAGALATGTYSVAVDGTAALTMPNPGVGIGSFTGQVLVGGGFALFAGSTVAGQNPGLLVLVRQSLTASNSTFSGSYFAAGLKFEDVPDFTQWTCFTGSAVPNGSGSLNYAATTENAEGAIGPNSGVDTYAVAPNGILTSSLAGGPFRQGAVSADGRFAFLSGEVVSGGNPPIFFLFVRKS